MDELLRRVPEPLTRKIESQNERGAVIFCTVSNTRMISRVDVRGWRSEHTHRSARRHVTHVCCAIVVFRAHRERARARDRCCANIRRWWVTADERGMLRVTLFGKEVTCAEQVCVTRQKSAPCKKEQHTQQDTAEQQHAPLAPPQAGLTHSHSLTLSLSLTLSTVTHAQCTAQAHVSHESLHLVRSCFSKNSGSGVEKVHSALCSPSFV